MIGIALGGNQPDSEKYLKGAIEQLTEVIAELRSSTLHQTEPLGSGSHRYLNAVVVGKNSDLMPLELWHFCEGLENQAGRDRASEQVWGDRPLDLDLLFYHDKVIVNSELLLPHPQLHRRSFVVEPLKEIFAEWIHPVLGKSIREY